MEEFTLDNDVFNSDYNKVVDRMATNELDAIIEINNLTKTYSSKFSNIVKKINSSAKVKEIIALDDVSLAVNKGEIFGLLGANGSGKTTLIKLLCGLIKPNSGEIKIFGKDIKENREEIVKDIGAIVEAPTLFKDMTGVENLQYFATVQGGLPKGRIDDVLQLVGLEDRKNSKFKTYSLGMQQRLGIAQAIMHNPKILLLDEPINGLDPDGIIQVRDILRKIRDNFGTTIFISSHILSEMQELCDRVAIMNKGHIVKVDTMKNLEEQSNGKTIAKIECDKPEDAVAILSEDASIEVKLVDKFVYVRFAGDKMAEINKKLALADILVKSIAIKKRSLEDVYKEIVKDEK